MRFDLTGQTVGRLTVIGPDPLSVKEKQKRWICLCSCGKKVSVFTGNLRRNHTKSCGCLLIEQRRKANIIHGNCPHRNPTRTYSCWQRVLGRCYNPKNKDWKYYGEKGITVCDKWKNDFREFLKDMGECPKGLEMDRINSDGNYEPSNCRWANETVQSRNRSIIKLSMQKARDIRLLCQAGFTLLLVGKVFGVSKQIISKIKNNLLWKENAIA